MLPYEFRSSSNRPVFLLLGAHSDDIEIGCGGTLLKLAQRYREARFVWVTLSADEEREAETRAALRRFLHGSSDVEVQIGRFRGSYFPDQYAKLKDFFETLKRFGPDVILTHCRDDLHQDHRIVNELTWNTFRNHAVLEYEIPKFDGDLGRPNAYVPLSRAQVEAKSLVLMECFASQRSRSWFTAETFQALARLRGIECNASEGFAEAFHAPKLCIDF